MVVRLQQTTLFSTKLIQTLTSLKMKSKEQHSENTGYEGDMMPDLADHVLMNIHISLNVGIRFIISIVGVITNLLNMAILPKLGLKDSMSVGLFSLSFTNFLVTCIQMASCVSFMLDLVCLNTGIDTRVLGYYTLGWAISALYEVSCWITAFVSVERCYCVISPFKVKQVFTRSRCIGAVMTIYLIHIIMHVPIFVYDGLEWIQITAPSVSNMTTEIHVLEFVSEEEADLYSFILDLAAGVSMWMFSQTVVVLCAVLMAYSLEASSKVRLSGTSEGSIGAQKLVYSKSSSTLSLRERRLVKIALCLALTLTCCNVPKMITTVVYYMFLDTEIDNQKDLAMLLWTIAITFESLDCSISFLVYLTLSCSYKREFNSICRRHVGNSNRTKVNTIA